MYLDNELTRLQSQLQTTTSEVNLLQLNAQSYLDSNAANNAVSNTNNNSRQQTQLIQINGLVAQDVEEMLIEERTKDIEKLNKDVVIINDLMKYVFVFVSNGIGYEMCNYCYLLCIYRDMSHIVQAAQPNIDSIHKSASDVSTRSL